MKVKLAQKILRIVVSMEYKLPVINQMDLGVKS